MNDNTVLRIKVPAHLYESVKEQLTLKEAKSVKAFGDWKVVKEKKLPKDGMEKVKEEKEMKDNKKTRSLDELRKAKNALDKKIQEMEGADKKEPVKENMVSPEIMGAIEQIVDFAKDNAGFLAGIGGITGIAKMIADKIKQDPEARKALDQKTGAGSTDTSFFREEKVEDK